MNKPMTVCEMIGCEHWEVCDGADKAMPCFYPDRKAVADGLVEALEAMKAVVEIGKDEFACPAAPDCTNKDKCGGCGVSLAYSKAFIALSQIEGGK